MYVGHYTAKVDEKGRVSFPARYRELLAEEERDDLFVASYKTDGLHCLDVYPLSQWIKLSDELRKRGDRSSSFVQYFQNVFLPSVQECRPDRQGRILLSARSREWAGVGGELVFVGMLSRLRIWSPENWAIVESRSAGLDENPDVVSVLAF